MENHYSLDQIDAMIGECDSWINLVESGKPGDASTQILISRYSRALIAFKVILEDAKDKPYTEASLDAICVALGLELLDRTLDAQAASEESKHQAAEGNRTPCQECGPGYFIGDEGCRHQRPLANE